MLLGGQLIIAQLLASGLVLLIAMTVHEFAHNYVGYRMGDPTPRDLGRLTLNPFVHINWIGWLMWVFIGFGILGSAPISEYRMKDRRWGYFWAVAAGPLSNLAIALVCAVIIRILIARDPMGILIVRDVFGLNYEPRQLLPTLTQILGTMFYLNLLLFVFNLLPFYPFDGWHMLRKLLPPQQAYVLERYQNESMYVFLFLILLSFARIPGLNILGWLVSEPVFGLSRILLGF